MATTTPLRLDWYIAQATSDLQRFLERPNDVNKVQLDTLLAEYRDLCETHRLTPPRYFNHATMVRQ